MLKWIVNFLKKFRASSISSGATTTPIVPPDEPSKADIIEAEYDRLSKENVRLKLQLERALEKKEESRNETTEAQHSNPIHEAETKKVIEQENQESIKTALPPPPVEEKPKPKPIPPPVKAKTIPRDKPSQTQNKNDYLWLQYKEDFIDNIRWTWEYEPQTGKKPRNLKPHCPDCMGAPDLMKEPNLLLSVLSAPKMYKLTFRCPYTFRAYTMTADYKRGDYAFIEDAIMWKIESGEYRDVISQRKDRFPFF